MELALNLIWFALSGLLCAGVVHAGRHSRLRIPLLPALGAVALLALLLFPAISLTDDLAQANLWAEGAVVEGAGHHLAGTLPLALQPLSDLVAALPVVTLNLLFALLLLAVLAWCARPRSVPFAAPLWVPRAWAMRPPPVAAAGLLL